MTRIDFYVLQSQEPQSRWDLVCRLAEKAVSQAQSVFIHSDSETDLQALDKALWHFREDSFVPHRLITAEASAAAAMVDAQAERVHLSTRAPTHGCSVLINLATAVPAFFSRFERTLEVVDQTQVIRDAGRERYRFYQRRGYPLKHHQMQDLYSN